jgi:cytoskeletal protein CcmA (bactofilin family)
MAEPAPGRYPVLPEGALFEGLLVLPRPSRIDGVVRGEVLAASDVWVGPTGCVYADLEVRAIVIEGRVEGDVTAAERIELRGTARIRGNVSAPRIAMDEGCVVDGTCAAGAPGGGGPAPQPRAASS